MKFKITINDNEYHADMVDCDLVNQIADMCPFEVTFKQHRNQEYFTKLPSQANDDGCPLTTTILKNKLIEYINSDFDEMNKNQSIKRIIEEDEDELGSIFSELKESDFDNFNS